MLHKSPDFLHVGRDVGSMVSAKSGNDALYSPVFQWIMSNIYPSVASIKSLNYTNIQRLNKQMNTYGNSTEG